MPEFVYPSDNMTVALVYLNLGDLVSHELDVVIGSALEFSHQFDLV